MGLTHAGTLRASGSLRLPVLRLPRKIFFLSVLFSFCDRFSGRDFFPDVPSFLSEREDAETAAARTVLFITCLRAAAFCFCTVVFLFFGFLDMDVLFRFTRCSDDTMQFF